MQQRWTELLELIERGPFNCLIDYRSITAPKYQFTTLHALGTPCETPSSHRQGREFGEDCLSARSFNVSSHYEREFHSRRPCRAAQGHHAVASHRGGLFLGYFLLAAQKKVTSSGAAPRENKQEIEARIPGCPRRQSGFRVVPWVPGTFYCSPAPPR